LETPLVKKSLVCRGITNYTLDTDSVGNYVPQAGDVAVFEIVELGKITRLQDDQELRKTLFQGDRILAAFGDRYATSQVEAYVPSFSMQELHLAGAGGVIGVVHSQNARLKDMEPTRVKLVGYATRQGCVINTKFLHMPRHRFKGNFPMKPKVILSLGSSMDSGKTTIAGGLARGLMLAGNRVAYMKLTGTAFTKDRNFVQDCGAHLTTDFSDAGFTSTYMCNHEEVMDIYETLMQEVVLRQPFDYLIIEVADGLFQRENKILLPDPRFQATVDHVIFSGGDSMSAMYGEQLLNEMGLPPFALSGKFTMSPLLVQEVEELTKLPVLTLDKLMEPEVVKHISPVQINTQINDKKVKQNGLQPQESAA